MTEMATPLPPTTPRLVHQIVANRLRSLPRQIHLLRMALFSLHSLFGKQSERLQLTVIFLASLVISGNGEEPNKTDASMWRDSQLKTIAQQIRDSDSEDMRREHAARQTWLRRWQPGRMLGASGEQFVESVLVKEPHLRDLERPEEITENMWRHLIAAQTELHALDNDDDRKMNLRAIIEAARQFEADLSSQLSKEAQQLPVSTAWVLAYARYRLGRALAYRELPIVREQWPISEPEQYEKQLITSYRKLINQTREVLPEFILLEDRMLRRSGSKGLALELLEANRQSIELKWYLKKRRDLLEELGWIPPYQEAAQLYREAGYSD